MSAERPLEACEWCEEYNATLRCEGCGLYLCPECVEDGRCEGCRPLDPDWLEAMRLTRATREIRDEDLPDFASDGADRSLGPWRLRAASQLPESRQWSVCLEPDGTEPPGPTVAMIGWERPTGRWVLAVPGLGLPGRAVWEGARRDDWPARVPARIWHEALAALAGLAVAGHWKARTGGAA